MHEKYYSDFVKWKSGEIKTNIYIFMHIIVIFERFLPSFGLLMSLRTTCPVLFIVIGRTHTTLCVVGITVKTQINICAHWAKMMTKTTTTENESIQYFRNRIHPYYYLRLRKSKRERCEWKELKKIFFLLPFVAGRLIIVAACVNVYDHRKFVVFWEWPLSIWYERTFENK